MFEAHEMEYVCWKGPQDCFRNEFNINPNIVQSVLSPWAVNGSQLFL